MQGALWSGRKRLAKQVKIESGRERGTAEEYGF